MSQDSSIKCEELREACAIGDLVKVSVLIRDGTNVNHQNQINGWTALHWSSKRGYAQIVEMLLDAGADKTLTNKDGKLPEDVTSSKDILKLLGSTREPTNDDQLPIVANYLAHPVFPYSTDRVVKNTESEMKQMTVNSHSTPGPKKPSVIVLKVRIALAADPDFIEVELDCSKKSLSHLSNLLCTELGVNTSDVAKIRKLPDTKLCKDSDVTRLKEWQELEVVLQRDLQRHNSLLSGYIASATPVKAHSLVY